MKILVADLGYLGDIVMSSVIFREIRGNVDAEIHFLHHPEVEPLLPLLDVDKAIPMKGFLSTLKTLWDERYDIAIHTNTSLKVNTLLYLSGAETRVGYDFNGKGFLHTVRVPIDRPTLLSGYRRWEVLCLLVVLGFDVKLTGKCLK